MSQDKQAVISTMEADMSEITKSISRPERPKAPMRFEAEMPARLHSRTIIERIQHIQTEVRELDSALAGMRSDLIDKIGIL